jgi:hypothetical protein
MDEGITSFVGLDVHKDSIAVAVAEASREGPRFIGTTGPEPAKLLKVLATVGNPATMQIVYEAGPCGYALAPSTHARLSMRSDRGLQKPATCGRPREDRSS